MGLHILGEVRTNIRAGTEMSIRLEQVNAALENPHVVIEHERYRSHGWFRKPEMYKVYDIVDTFDNCILVESTDQRGVELYLLGMMNGHKTYTLDLLKKKVSPDEEERIANGSIIRYDIDGRQFTIVDAIQTNNQFSYGVYLYKLEGTHISLYRREFTVIKEGAV